VSATDPPTYRRMDGRYANPWPDSAPSGTLLAMLKWQWQRIRYGRPAAPARFELPATIPRIALPRTREDECRITWLGQSGFLVQSGSINLLTDPLLSRRASPFKWIGPARYVDAALSVDALPPIDAVLLSHDHYDHLDVPTIKALLTRFGSDLPIYTPLGYGDWFERLGARNVNEAEWWQSLALPNTAAELFCLPAQHWCRRGLDMGQRLWCSWLIRAQPFSVYFCGDSGYCPAFREISARVGSPDIALMPIGAYEPRWFMKPAHMNPEEAVQAFMELGARDFVAMHWGTFRLTDEPMLEPPIRLRNAWAAQRLPPDRLHVPAHGETLRWKAT
jgi:N-acyl-phosphatidylethanolamine-hydrolysing phospholipase D